MQALGVILLLPYSFLHFPDVLYSLRVFKSPFYKMKPTGSRPHKINTAEVEQKSDKLEFSETHTYTHIHTTPLTPEHV